MLLYADDLVILARSIEDVQWKLRILHDYCKENGLTVNVKKTEIVPFRAGGNFRDLEKIDFRFGEQKINVVSNYVYLGIPFPRSGLGTQAAKAAVNKAKIATGTVFSILQKSRADSWYAKTKLYNSIVTPTLLYAVGAWGPAHLEQLEEALTSYFKKLLRLPKNTAGYQIRLECNLNHISVKALEFIFNWIIKLLQMKSDRYPRICLNKLISIKDIKRYPKKFNWVAILDELFVSLNFCNLWDNLNLDIWKENAPLITKKYAEQRRLQDLQSYENSKSFIFRLERLLTDKLPLYLHLRLPLEISRVIAQLRLANIYRCCFYFKRNWYKLESESICRMCNLNKNESIQHIFLECPIYKPYRKFFLDTFLQNEYTESKLTNLLKLQNKKAIFAIYNFFTSSLMLRAEFVDD